MNYLDLEDFYLQASRGEIEPAIILKPENMENIKKCLTCDEPAATYVHPDNVLCNSCREYVEQ